MNLYDITKKYILNDIELVIIETIINELSKGNQKISIRDIASQTYVSTTIIVKLAKKLGFVGYSQMLYLIFLHMMELLLIVLMHEVNLLLLLFFLKVEKLLI